MQTISFRIWTQVASGVDISYILSNTIITNLQIKLEIVLSSKSILTWNNLKKKKKTCIFCTIFAV